MRHFWGWVWVCLLVMGVTGVAEAEEGFLPLPVCVRPPNVDKSITLWSYWAGGHTQVRRLNPGFSTQRYPQPTFLYDPNAPPENTKALPDRYKDLPCDPKPPPPTPPPEPEKPTPKKEPPKQARAGGSGSSGDGEHNEKGEEKEQAQSPPPAPPPRVAEEEARHPRLPDHGVTTDWPKSVLPTKEALLPTKRRDDRCAWELPWQGQKPIDRAQVCKRDGDGDGHGDGDGDGGKGSDEELRTWLGKATTDMAVLAAVVNMQFDEDLERKDGKRYGIVGGKNLDGPDAALVQAFASITLIAAVVLSPKAEAFEKKLKDAWAKGTRLLMKDMEKVGEGVAEELAKKEVQEIEQKLVQKGGEPLKASAKREAEKFARANVADALTKNGGSIGPYNVMKQFTEKLEGRWQAHHILEVRWKGLMKIKNTDTIPSVILTEAEHKEVTAKLAAKVGDIIKVDDIAERRLKLWEVYQTVYEGHSEWLKAIRPYFFKGK